MKKYSKVGGREGKPAYRTPSDFRQKVFKAVKNIPRGKTLSYKDVAKKAGKPKAYRVVGNILHKSD